MRHKTDNRCHSAAARSAVTPWRIDFVLSLSMAAKVRCCCAASAPVCNTRRLNHRARRIALGRRGTQIAKEQAMDTIRNESMIKLALDTVDLVILRWQVDKAMSNKPVDRQEYYRLIRARDLLAECNTTMVLQ